MKEVLRDKYSNRFFTVLQPLTHNLQEYLDTSFKGVERIDRIVTRAKTIDRFMVKAKNQIDGKDKYSNPLRQIQDQIGARIITFYLSDVERVAEVAVKYFRHIQKLDIVPDSESEFGYFGKHFIMFLPNDVFKPEIKRDDAPTFFELQIKTLFQHAWAEANHDLGYKAESEISPGDNRKIAFTSAQAWGADMIFEGLLSQRGKNEQEG